MTAPALERFLASVQRTPDAIAVEGSAVSLSYAELARRAAGRARALVDRGIGLESKVALCLTPSVETIEVMLAAFWAGAAFIPLDPNSPPARIAAMLDAARPELIVSRDGLIEWEPLASHPRIAVSELGSPAEPTLAPARVPTSASAYIVFTSGSTGAPKGVVIQHAGVMNMIDQQISTFRIGATSRVLQFASLSFDASVSEVFTALCAGATLCLVEHPRDRQGLALVDMLARRRISVVTFPPTLLRALPANDLADLATVVSAGEACTPDVVEHWRRRGRTLINAYGPSETTVCATMKVMERPADAATIGSALSGLDLYVLDEQLARVTEPGVEGELYIGGAGVARGYVNRPDLTAERFVPHPWAAAATPGARLYRTGDRVRWSPVGELEYLGREDDQVKVRGFRIEPGEVEAVLRRAPGVGDVLVMQRRRSTGDALLAAYVLGDPALEPSLRVFARRELAEFMQPAHYVFVDAWPRLPSGKIDRKALAAIEPTRTASDSASESETEKQLRVLFAQLLELPSVGLDDSFFDIGGDSILAMRLLSRIEAQLRRRIPVSALFERPTPAGLARWLDGVATPDAAAPLTLRAGDRKAPLWFIPPVHGNSLCYFELARRMAPGAACFGLQVPGIDDGATPFTNLDELAKHLVATVRRTQPHGPYRLIGWSLGGTIAHHMAVELQRQGEDVPVLIMIASTPPTHEHIVVARQMLDDYAVWKMCHMYGSQMTFSTGGRVDLPAHFLKYRGLDDERAIAQLTEELGSKGMFTADLSTEEVRRWVSVFRSSLRGFHFTDASTKYRGNALSLSSTHHNPMHTSPMVDRKLPPGDWRNHVEELTVWKVPGDHLNLMSRPWVDDVADALDRWLAR